MHSPDSPSPAERTFADWLARFERGEAESREELLAAHPTLAEELGELHDEWRALPEFDVDDEQTNGNRTSLIAWLRRVLRGP